MIAENLNRIKGETVLDLDSSGDLNMDEYIAHEINTKAKIPNMDFDMFDDEDEITGLDVYLILDCSLSMHTAGNQLRNIAGTIFEALTKCDFITFKTVCYSGSFDRELYVQKITRADQISSIVADRKHRGTCTDLALNYVNSDIEKNGSDNRKNLVILFTDGLPEDDLSFDEMQKSISQEIVKMKNQDISFFTLYYENISYYNSAGYSSRIDEIKTQMKNIFRNSIYVTRDFDDIQRHLIRNLEESVERLNQNAS